MARRRNKLGQYVPNEYRMYINIPSPFKVLKYLLIAFIVSPWIFLLFYKFEIKVWLLNLMENIFLINKDEGKKTNGFF